MTTCGYDIKTLPGRWTAGDLEDPISVQWNEVLTTETSELIIDRPSPSAAVTVAGTLTDASTGTFQYPWSAGDLVAGEGQLVKARLYRSGSRRKSTVFFRINVDADIS